MPTPSSRQSGDHLGLEVAAPQRPLALQRRDRVHGVRRGGACRRRPPTNRGSGPCPRSPARPSRRPSPRSACSDRCGARSRGRWCRCRGARATRRTTHARTRRRRCTNRFVGSVGSQPDAELGRDGHLVAAALDRLPDEPFVRVRPVHVGGVEERDAEVEGAVNRCGSTRRRRSRRRRRSCPCSRGLPRKRRGPCGRGAGGGRSGGSGHAVLLRYRSILKSMAPRQSFRCSRSCSTRRRWSSSSSRRACSVPSPARRARRTPACA